MIPALSDRQHTFSTRLIAWQKIAGRHTLPWQNTQDPYKIWLSEIMLQQTQVDTVIPYYLRFLAKFPTVHDLAKASLDEVLALWSGLGYYARARNLHRCAQAVHIQGHFPQTALQLAQLPGIGESTAAAIAAFAFEESAAILDGNVRRVLARIFGLHGDPSTVSVRNEFWQLARQLVPKTDIRAYTQGLMDLGATCCTRNKPICLEHTKQPLFKTTKSCPFQQECIAYNTQQIAHLPTPKIRRAMPNRSLYLLLAYNDQGAILLEQRPPSGIWGGLWSLPEYPIETSSATPNHAPWLKQLHLTDVSEIEALPFFRHTFTHYHLHLYPLHTHVFTHNAPPPSHRWITPTELPQYGLPKPIKTLLKTK